MIESAGIIPFRYNNENGKLEFFLGHPGGYYHIRPDYWTYLKGGVEKGENWLDTAIREFREESGVDLSSVNKNRFISLGSVQQNSYKMAIAYGIYYADIDPEKCTSNLVEGKDFPEIDSYRWMDYDEVEKHTHQSHMSFYNQIADFSK